MVVTDRVANDSAELPPGPRSAGEGLLSGGGRARAVTVKRDDGRMTAVADDDFDRRFNCSRCGTLFPEPTPALFSANSPLGACPACEGFGRTAELDLEKVIPDPRLSLRQGLIAPWRTPAYREMQTWMLKCARRARVRTAVPFREMTETSASGCSTASRATSAQWAGGGGRADDGSAGRACAGFSAGSRSGATRPTSGFCSPGIAASSPAPPAAAPSSSPRRSTCVVEGATIAEVGRLAVRELRMAGALGRLARRRRARRRRAARTRKPRRLSQRSRPRLPDARASGAYALRRRSAADSSRQRARQPADRTLYALDEPTVGLHAGDSRRLLGVLRTLRDVGNTVVVVEHDPMMIAGADYHRRARSRRRPSGRQAN